MRRKTALAGAGVLLLTLAVLVVGRNVLANGNLLGRLPRGGGAGAALACAPAVAVGAAGELVALERVDDGTRATALFDWSADAADADAEREAVRTLATSRARGAMSALGRGGRALAVTADGATLRALAVRAPAAHVTLAVAGTHALCVLD